MLGERAVVGGGGLGGDASGTVLEQVVDAQVRLVLGEREQQPEVAAVGREVGPSREQAVEPRAVADEDRVAVLQVTELVEQEAAQDLRAVARDGGGDDARDGQALVAQAPQVADEAVGEQPDDLPVLIGGVDGDGEHEEVVLVGTVLRDLVGGDVVVTDDGAARDVVPVEAQLAGEEVDVAGETPALVVDDEHERAAVPLVAGDRVGGVAPVGGLVAGVVHGHEAVEEGNVDVLPIEHGIRHGTPSVGRAATRAL